MTPSDTPGRVGTRPTAWIGLVFGGAVAGGGAEPAGWICPVILTRSVAAKKGYDDTGLDALAKLLSQPEQMAVVTFAAGRLLVDFGEE